MLPDSPDCGLSPNNPGRDGTRSSRRLFAYSPEPKVKVSRKPTEPLPSAQLSAAASGAAQARWVVGPQLALRRFALPLPLRREFILPLPLGPGAGLPLPLLTEIYAVICPVPSRRVHRQTTPWLPHRPPQAKKKNGTKIVGNSPLLLTTIRLPARALVLPLPLRPSLDLPLPLRPHAILPLPPNPSWGSG